MEIALWDILGKHYGAPVCHLLGGRMRSRIPTCNTCIGFGDLQDYRQWHEDAGELARSLGIDLNPDMLTRPDLIRQVSEGEGLAQGRRTMGDHWAVEHFR